MSIGEKPPPAQGSAYVDVTMARLSSHRIPAAAPDKVRLARRYQSLDPTRAVLELGFPRTHARVALRKVKWYRATGYAPERRRTY
jgi:hypothetical protein